jgi:ribosomal protein S18 acetylase RimI-like enzyme
MLENIEIIEYEKKYASKIAEMWNKSSEGWQGEQLIETEQSIISSEESSAYLKLYLALYQNEIIGYCKLSEYEEDKDTWYVDLLNVRPDFHGKKIGKKLLLTALKYSQKKGIPRVDLHTWDGNLKAVPLYKKCGFFWVNYDNSTHLVNLIPKVLQMELFTDFFKRVDWYQDSNRKIEVKPDGVKIGEFEYWTYSWQKNNEFLEIDFCRRGKGIRRIETQDYKIIATIEKRKLIFGKNYKIKYEIENKTGKKLNIEIASKNVDMIKFNFQQSLEISGTKIIEAEFFIDKIEDVINEEKNQPNVTSEFVINGKSVLLEVGISPQFPIKLKIQKNNFLFKNIENECWFLIENMSDKNIDLEIRLASDGNLSFKNSLIKLNLKGKAKTTLKNYFTFKKADKYQKDVEIKINDNGNIFTYSRDIEFFARTINDKMSILDRNNYSIVNGRYYLVLMKKNERNAMFFGKDSEDEKGFYFPLPSFGKPFNSEFAQITPKFVTSKNENSILAKIIFTSEKFSKAELIYHFELFQNGVLKMQVEVDRKNWKDDLEVATYVWYPKKRTAFFIDGKIVKIPQDNPANESSLWDYEKIEENWMMTKDSDDGSNLAIIWNDDFKFAKADWKNILKLHIPKNTEKFVSKEVTFFIDTISNINDLRILATKKNVEKHTPKPFSDYLINNGNPFVNSNFDVNIHCNVENKKSGKFIISSKSSKEKTLEISDQKKNIIIPNIELTELQEVNFLNITNVDKGISKTTSLAFFQKGKENIKLEKREIDNKEVLSASNNLIEISASKDFAPSIFSMKFKGREWLDSSFPKLGPKSWWNPWAGGILFKYNGMRLQTILEEKSCYDFALMTDQFGNKWEGISIKTEYQKNEKFSGRVITQYFLLLPNSPVMAKFVIVKNNTGFRSKFRVLNMNFLKSEKVENTYYEFVTKENERIKVQGGISEISYASELGVIGGFDRAEKLYFTKPLMTNKVNMGANAETILTNTQQKELIDNKTEKIFKPSFIIFSEKEIDNNQLKMLLNIEFNKIKRGEK